MRSATLLLAASLSLLPLGSAHAIDRLASGFPELPKDARKVAERSVACIYFSGEFNGDKGERDQEVTAQLRKLQCAHVARDLRTMRAKYQKNPKILAALEEVDQ
ncbi:hypothetical protein [Undibacterium sp. RuTC16W]|uniref:hypothetical protein n=1 Tax=Undibacterium sp. RuTC16W TaxID=3413048 RepID=UPI003BF38DDE